MPAPDVDPPLPPEEPAAESAPGTQPAPSVVETAASPAPAGPAAPSPAELAPAQCAAELAQRFPALFAAAAAPKPGDAAPRATVLPVKLRIHADIQQRAPGVFTRRVLSAFLHRYTTSNAYLRALLQAPSRFDLDGAAAGEIDPVHRQAAQVELERRRALAVQRSRPPREQPAKTAAAAVAPSDAAPGDEAAARPRPSARERNLPARKQRPTHGPSPAREAARPQPRSLAATNSTEPELGPGPVQALAAGDADQRERQMLLRAWEASPLTKANFCALKRLGEQAFDALIAQAKAERSRAAAAASSPAPLHPGSGRPPR